MNAASEGKLKLPKTWHLGKALLWGEILDTDHVFGQNRKMKNQADIGEQIRLIHLVLCLGAEQSLAFASS